MYQEINIPVAYLKAIIASLPSHQLTHIEQDRRRYKLEEPVNLYDNPDSPLPPLRRQRELEFEYNFITNDWELKFIITY